MSQAHEWAMEKAIELHKGTGVSAEDLAATAETIRRYCAGDFEGKTLPVSLSSLLAVNGSGHLPQQR
ncbi:hypothetical protein S1001342_01832 [Acetobacter pasteurianus subsp. pasteurianus]|uniref:Uncharacterized protein n=1 Tax=Acetobacter pasteurianus subsp. pasteurianus TaxID=481145 RepID=A0A1Y0YAZ8_ACEPA|nr:hypothetical protein S1001342_01832 [Acetobacter pasteurianus subsp. pasteurianus]